MTITYFYYYWLFLEVSCIFLEGNNKQSILSFSCWERNRLELVVRDKRGREIVSLSKTRCFFVSGSLFYKGNLHMNIFAQLCCHLLDKSPSVQSLVWALQGKNGHSDGFLLSWHRQPWENVMLCRHVVNGLKPSVPEIPNRAAVARAARILLTETILSQLCPFSLSDICSCQLCSAA